MTKYKLSNIIKKSHDGKSQKKKFSFAYLNNLCKTYVVSECVTDSFCCYGEDSCCWQDELTCWIYGSQEKINRKVYSYIKAVMNRYGVVDKQKMFIWEYDKEIVVCIPMRHLTNDDIWMVFSKIKLG